jgi:non-specific serine/threonine protein kinase
VLVSLNSFVGRQNEVAEVRRLLGANRLLMLTGPGGCGKTRLALAVSQAAAPQFADGVALVELAPLADPALVPQSVAAALGVHEQPGRSVAEILSDHLRPHQALLVFDNCEHLVAACAGLAVTLLQACPALRILATSREALQVAGETVWVVPPLSLPQPQPWRSPESPQQALAAYQQSEAVRLFVDRAAGGSPGFALTADNAPWVADICRRLDGMPLAIELAAARVRALSPKEIAARLEDRFHLLSAGSRTAPARHQSLAAALDWSHTLLDEPERKLLRRLSVFAGGFSLAAAEAVCPDADLPPSDVLNTLSSLVDKSLVQPDQAEGETRYRLLETIRQYAARRLEEAGEAVTWHDRHLAYFSAWARDAEPHLWAAEIVPWLRRYDRETDNLRAALDWAQASPAWTSQNLELVALYGRFWRLRGFVTEGRTRIAAALARPGADSPANAAARAQALYWGAVLAFFQSDYTATRAQSEASLALFETLGDVGTLGVAGALELLAEVDTEQGYYASAQQRYSQAKTLYRDVRRVTGLADTMTMLGWVAMRSGDLAGAADHLDEALAYCRQAGNPNYLAQALAGRGELAVRQGQFALAGEFLEEGLALSRQMSDPWRTAVTLGTLGWAALLQRNFSRARERLGESLSIRLESGDIGGSAWCLERLAEVTLLEGKAGHERAARIFAAAAAQRARVNAAMDDADRPAYEQNLTSLRASLGDEAFAAAWESGAALSREQAAEVALAAPAESPASGETFGGLTARERQVAALIAQGHSNRKIAELMVVNVKTVETYVTRILGKLDFDSRVKIATWAIQQGLVRPGDP